jgi:hypothetical protein
MFTRAIAGLLLFAPLVRAQSADSSAVHGAHYVRNFGLGVAASILLHEMGHIGASVIQGARPTFGFDELRPTVFSGIDSQREPRKQFWFSSAGLDVQAVLNEVILDVPHARGSAFERGMLAGGIGTTVFYLTIGRTGSVSDVDFMARTRVMTKTEVTLLYGTIAAAQTWRISRNPAYAHFFAAPDGNRLRLGWSSRLP